LKSQVVYFTQFRILSETIWMIRRAQNKAKGFQNQQQFKGSYKGEKRKASDGQENIEEKVCVGENVFCPLGPYCYSF